MWSQNAEATGGKDTDAIRTWIGGAVEGFPKARAREALDRSRLALELMEKAARRRECHWELPVEGGNIFSIPLPDVGVLRHLAMLVALEARLNIVEAHYDEALTNLQTGFALVQHLSQDGPLIYPVLGFAIAEMMNQQLQLWVQMPDSPNLYWALAELPQPLVPIARACSSSGWQFGVTCLEPRVSSGRSSAKKRHRELVTQIGPALEHIAADRAALDEAFPLAPPSPDTIRTMIERLKASSSGLPSGLARLDVDYADLTPMQLMALDRLQQIRNAGDEQWSLGDALPYWQAELVAQRDSSKHKAGDDRSPGRLFSGLFPAILQVRRGQARVQRRLAALTCVEAIRMYSASHDGRLPAQLSDIVEVPVPSDPVTGKPFSYSVSGDHAELQSGSIPGRGPLKFELRLAP